MANPITEGGKSNLPDLKSGQFSTNWETLKKTITEPKKSTPSANKQGHVNKNRPAGKRKSQSSVPSAKRKSADRPEIWFDDVDIEDIEGGTKTPSASTSSVSESLCDKKMSLISGPLTSPTKEVAMDCEMVGTGLDGSSSVLARCSIVNAHGHVLLDKFVRPKERVTDFRTFVSGVRPKNLKEAEKLEDIQKQVAVLITGRILVGHAVHHDLKVLMLSHPLKDTRDTAFYKPFRSISRGKTPALKRLAKAFLDINIQSGEHSSVEDSQAVMRIYQMHKKEWKSYLRRKGKSKRSDKKRNIRNTGLPEESC